LSAKASNSHERSDTATTNEPSAESIDQLKATVMHLRESINHLKEVNKEVSAKYDKQKEFISIATHEMRSPILPILGTLELIEYEFEEDKKRNYTEK
jgi:signal transduction histidine kinase